MTGRHVLVADRFGDTWAAEVLEVVQTASPDAVQVTYRLPNGEEHRGFFRPEAIVEGPACCDWHGYPNAWGPGGKFIETGLRRVDPENVAKSVCDLHYETDDD